MSNVKSRDFQLFMNCNSYWIIDNKWNKRIYQPLSLKNTSYNMMGAYDLPFDELPIVLQNEYKHLIKTKYRNVWIKLTTDSSSKMVKNLSIPACIGFLRNCNENAHIVDFVHDRGCALYAECTNNIAYRTLKEE